MELTHKCKADFEKWFMEDYILRAENVGRNIPYLKMLERSVPAVRYGVYEDFFETHKIYMQIQIYVEPTMQGPKFKKWKPDILWKNEFRNVSASGHKQIARIYAVKKANEIYNEQI
jgi:hypothetical protein